MPEKRAEKERRKAGLSKCPTGIRGLDEISGGGLPRGRPSLVCGGAGCGKTMMGMEFLYRGAVEYGEPGVFMAFEEKRSDLADNFTSLGFDLEGLIDADKLRIDFVYIERSEIAETGEYDLEGLFVRLASAIDSIGAQRVVLDTIEALFSGFSNQSILRAELRRLFRWLKEKGVTAIVTGEKGKNLLTKHGLEEYVADCVIFLDHRVTEQVATRRLKIIKYRGSRHGTNEYPFLIGEDGITIFPITSISLTGKASSQRISSGIAELDRMLDGKGFYRGSAVLISGGAGSGKTSVLSQFVDSVCSRGKRALFFTYEETPAQIIRNMRSIGLNLEKWVKKGLLRFSAHRGARFGLEQHLVAAHRLIEDFNPEAVAIDPISDLTASGTIAETQAMLTRLIDILKEKEITILATDLTVIGIKEETTEIGISSICDAWIKLNRDRRGYEMKRRINILKARGIDHSHRIRELVISDRGLTITDITTAREDRNE